MSGFPKKISASMKLTYEYLILEKKKHNEASHHDTYPAQLYDGIQGDPWNNFVSYVL